MKKPKYLLVYLMGFLFVGLLILFILIYNGNNPFDSINNIEDEEEDRLINLLDENSAMPSEPISPVLMAEHKETISKLQKSCLSGKDCFPSIDNPKFTDVISASSFLTDDDIVLGLEKDGEFRAYPLKILNWHEIVNDNFAGKPIVVTFCPFSYSFNVFSAIIEQDPLSFGVSGYLLENNLVIYDRETGSFWSQVTGEALTGTKIGKKLKKLDFHIVTWGEWKRNHSDTKVLSTETGYIRDYEIFPFDDREAFEKNLIEYQEKSGLIFH